MKVLISLSEKTFEYTGTHGFYCQVSVPSEEARFIAKLLKQNGLSKLVPADLDGLHCTIMYSKDAIPKEVVDSNLGSIKAFKAYVQRIESWEGHDKKGYITLKLNSIELNKRHNFWKQAGATHSFEDYTPHITLVTGFMPDAPLQSVIDKFNTKMGKIKYPVLLEDEYVEDLS